jgi:hypothetical protein
MGRETEWSATATDVEDPPERHDRLMAKKRIIRQPEGVLVGELPTKKPTSDEEFVRLLSALMTWYYPGRSQKPRFGLNSLAHATERLTPYWMLFAAWRDGAMTKFRLW